MKKLSFQILFIFFCQLLIAQHVFEYDKIAANESKAYKTTAARDIHLVSNHGFQIYYHDLYFEIDPAIKFIKGKIYSIIKIENSQNSRVIFDCSNALIVDSIKRESKQLTFVQTDSNELQIDLGEDKQNEMLDTFIIYYHGIPSSNGFGSFSQTYHDGVPNIWTLSEPYGASDWWPCKQSLNDKIDSIDIHIKIPVGNLAASNGLLKSIDTLTDGYLFNWQHRYPIATYLVALSVSNYTAINLEIPLKNNNLSYINYVYPENYIEALDGVLLNIQVMKLFDSLFVPYPFLKEKYGHAQFGWGGGMEHQTMSFVTNFNFELLAHELAHQWFGDMISCGSWQDIWLNEGFATYLSGLSYENLLGGIYWPIFKEQLINKICNKPDGSVYIPSPLNPEVARVFDSRLSYAKGAMVLHMLRWKIGDDAFFIGMKNYLNNPNLQYKFSLTSDFKAAMEQASQQNLNTFFNNWIYGEGYPSYQINWKQNLNNDSILLKIEQSTSHPSVNFFDMPIAIKFFNTSTSKTIVLNNTTNNEFFKFDLGFKADSASFDPDRWIVQKGSNINNITQSLLNDELTIYFNSTSVQDELSFEINSEKDENINLYVVNASGQQLIRENLAIQFGKLQKTYNISNFSKGLYILYIESKGEKHSYKFLKSK